VRARPPACARPPDRVCVTRRDGGGPSFSFFRLIFVFFAAAEDPSPRNFTQRHRHGDDGRGGDDRPHLFGNNYNIGLTKNEPPKRTALGFG